jgi:hypothetical protein
MNRKPKWLLALEQAAKAMAKATPFLVALAAVLRELHPYLSQWLA